MKFPKVIRHRKAEVRIYGKSKSYPLYRLCAYVAGKRRMTSFRTYSEAAKAAETLVRDLAQGSQVAALSSSQAVDAMAALSRLQRHYENTKEKLSLLEAVSNYCEAASKLNGGGHTVGEAVERFLTTVAVVQRKPLSEAVTEYLAEREANFKRATEEAKKKGKRPPSSVYAYNLSMWLREFANTFPGYAVCNLSKDHLNTYIKAHGKVSAKSRNDRRAVLKMFFKWCAVKDYVSQNSRVLEATDLKNEEVHVQEIDFYRPGELRKMLDSADSDLKPVVALGALAGLRREEILRLEWADVWRVKDKVEISARIAKGRKRRLVSICPSLGEWLRPYRHATGMVWNKSADALEEALAALRDTIGIPARRNGLRHSFVTFFMAQHSNENLAAAECGNSPQMIHEHYRELATRQEALRWFSTRPSKTKAANIVRLAVQ